MGLTLGIRTRELWEWLKDFKYVFYLDLLILVPSLIFVLLPLSPETLISSLAASRRTPWGIFTSVFIHGNISNHFLPNAVYLVIFSMLFVLTDNSSSRIERAKRSKFFFGVVMFTAFLVNLLWIILTPSMSFGASGAVYAAEGSVLWATLTNIIPYHGNINVILQKFRSRRNLRLTLSNLLVFLVIFIPLVISPKMFLEEGEGVNIFAHGVGFLIAFVISWLYEPLRKNVIKYSEDSTLAKLRNIRDL